MKRSFAVVILLVAGCGGANTPHSYHTVEDAEFLTIVTKGNASKFFRQVSSEVSMNPPDIQGVVRVGGLHGIEFLPPA